MPRPKSYCHTQTFTPIYYRKLTLSEIDIYNKRAKPKEYITFKHISLQETKNLGTVAPTTPDILSPPYAELDLTTIIWQKVFTEFNSLTLPDVPVNKKTKT
jgi:hypothetical protein